MQQLLMVSSGHNDSLTNLAPQDNNSRIQIANQETGKYMHYRVNNTRKEKT